MKFFTMARWRGDDSSGWPLDAYRNHLQSIRSQIPAWFIEPDFSTHDSRLRLMHMDVRRAELVMELDDATRISDDGHLAENGRARMGFGEVSLVECLGDPKLGLPGPSGFGDWGYDEIDVLDGNGLELRVLFSSAIELRVCFGDFKAEWLGTE